MAVHKLRHFFCTISDHYLPLCHLLTYSPLPPTRWRNLWMGNDISMIDYFVRRTLTSHGYFSSWSNFLCFWGERFDFHCYVSMVKCLIVLWLSFLFYPLPHNRHLSSFARPLPPLCHLLSSFGLPPRTPWLDDVIYEQPLRDYQKLHFDTITYTVL